MDLKVIMILLAVKAVMSVALPFIPRRIFAFEGWDRLGKVALFGLAATSAEAAIYLLVYVGYGVMWALFNDSGTAPGPHVFTSTWIGRPALIPEVIWGAAMIPIVWRAIIC